MLPTSAEIASLRAEGLAMGLDKVGPLVLTTFAEQIGFMHLEMLSQGMEEDEVLRNIALVLLAAEVDRESVREARGVLRQLSYSPALLKQLTQVARRAQPRERYQPGAGLDASIGRRVDEVALAPELLRLTPKAWR